MDYNEQDLAFQQRVRNVLEEKALLGGRRPRRHSRRRKHSKKGKGLSGGTLSGGLTGGRRSRKHSSRRKRGRGVLTGGSTSAQRRAAAHARASKRSRRKRVSFGRGYDEPMEGGYRRKRRSSMKYRRGRGVGGALTRQEIDKLLKDPTPTLARDYTEVDRIRTRNPAQDLYTAYNDVVVDLQIKKDKDILDIMKQIESLQNAVNFKSAQYDMKASEVAQAFASAQFSEATAEKHAKELLESAQKRVSAARKSYSNIFDSADRLVPKYDVYTLDGRPVIGFSTDPAKVSGIGPAFSPYSSSSFTGEELTRDFPVGDYPSVRRKKQLAASMGVRE